MTNNSFFSSKGALIAVSLWLLLILSAVFYFLGLFQGIHRIILATSTISITLSIASDNLWILLIFSLVNSLIIVLGLRSRKLARILKIDLILLLLGIGVVITAYVVPCEGFSCLGNAFLLRGGVFAVVSVFSHAPLLYLVMSGASRKAIGMIALVFILMTISVPALTYIYLAKTLPEKLEVSISQALKEMGITIFKPTYLPDRDVDRYSEAIVGDKYSMFYVYKSGAAELLDITQRAARKEGIKEYENPKEGRKNITIHGNPAIVSTTRNIAKVARFNSRVDWIEEGTQITVVYGFFVGTAESVESEAVKIAESMEPQS